MKLFLKILGVVFSLPVFSQIDIDTTAKVTSWQLTRNYSIPYQIEVDTSLESFRYINPATDYSISNSTLGNYGSPVTQNVFSDRFRNEDAFYLNQYMPYLLTYNNTCFFNTKSPFSKLAYTTEAVTSLKEQSFDVFHTQNLNSKWNFGFKYHLISAKGQYLYQSVKAHSFNLFTSYTGKKYMMHAAFNINRLRNDESGGIIDSIFTQGLYEYKIEIPTQLSGMRYYPYTADAQNKIRYYDILLSQRLKLFTLASKVDSTKSDKKRNLAEPVLTYVFKTSRSTKSYSDISPVAPGFYEHVYFNKTSTCDSLTTYKVNNTLQLDFITTFRGKVQAGIYGLVGHELEINSMYSAWDTGYFTPDTITDFVPDPYIRSYTINNVTYYDTLRGFEMNKDPIQNFYYSTGIFGNFWGAVNTQFSGTVYFLGRKSKQTSLEGILDSKFKLFEKEFSLLMSARFENKIPTYLLENYYSNNYIWNAKLKPENSICLSSRMSSSSNNLAIGVNYYVLRNLIYFNSNAVPENIDEDVFVNYLSLKLYNRIRLWKIYSVNELIYQASNKSDTLVIPDFVWHNSTYFDHTFKFKVTKGALRTMLGIDIYYSTRFKGYKYSPSLAQFYLQNEKEIGNYPLMDAFLSVRVKRASCFVKWEHLGSSWFKQDNYFSTVHYPYYQNTIKIGISWLFYD